jgi:cold shock CspA family protein
MPNLSKGIVDEYFPDRDFGFIDQPSAGHNRTFFHARSCIRDAVGRIPPIGALVEYERDFENGKALNVRNVAESPDPRTYTEIGFVKMNRPTCGWVKRSDGGSVFCHLSEVITEGADLLTTVGAWIRYKVGKTVGNNTKDCAWDIEILLPESEQPDQPDYEPGSAEDIFLTAPELPLAPKPEPEPERAERELRGHEDALLQPRSTATR